MRGSNNPQRTNPSNPSSASRIQQQSVIHQSQPQRSRISLVSQASAQRRHMLNQSSILDNASRRIQMQVSQGQNRPIVDNWMSQIDQRPLSQDILSAGSPKKGEKRKTTFKKLLSQKSQGLNEDMVAKSNQLQNLENSTTQPIIPPPNELKLKFFKGLQVPLKPNQLINELVTENDSDFKQTISTLDASQPRVVLAYFSELDKNLLRRNYEVIKKENSTISNQYQTMSGSNSRCIFHENQIKVVSDGGEEFTIPFQLDVHSIYPLEDGVLIQAIFSNDQLYFDFESIVKNQQGIRKTSFNVMNKDDNLFAYFVVTGHPLNEVHPLGYNLSGRDQNSQIELLIKTDLEIVKITSFEFGLPLVIGYSKSLQSLKLMLLRESDSHKRKVDHLSEELFEDYRGIDSPGEDPYMLSLKPESRHQLFHFSPNYPSLVLEQLWEIRSTIKPSAENVGISAVSGVKDERFDYLDLMVYLLYGVERQLAFIRWPDIIHCDPQRQAEAIKNPNLKAERVEKDVMSLQIISQIIPTNFSIPEGDFGEFTNLIEEKFQNSKSRETSQLQGLRLRCLQKLKNHVLILKDKQPSSIELWEGASELCGINARQIIPENELGQNLQVIGLMRVGSGLVADEFSRFIVRDERGTRVVRLSLTPPTLKDDYLFDNVLRILRIIIPRDLFWDFYRHSVDLVLNQKRRLRGLSELFGFDNYNLIVEGLIFGQIQKYNSLVSVVYNDNEKTEEGGKIVRNQSKLVNPKKGVKIGQTQNDEGEESSEVWQFDPFGELLHLASQDPWLPSLEDLIGDEDAIRLERLRQEWVDKSEIEPHILLSASYSADSAKIKRSKSGVTYSKSRSQNMLLGLKNSSQEEEQKLDSESKIQSLPIHILKLVVDLWKYRDQILTLLHYLYQDISLNSLGLKQNGLRLGQTILTGIISKPASIAKENIDIIFNMEVDSLQDASSVSEVEMGNRHKMRILKKLGFIQYYLTRHPCLHTRFYSQVVSLIGDGTDDILSYSPNFVEIESVPDISQTLTSILQNLQIQVDFEVFYENSRKILRFLQIFKQNEQGLISRPIHQIKYPRRQQQVQDYRFTIAPIPTIFMLKSQIDWYPGPQIIQDPLVHQDYLLSGYSKAEGMLRCILEEQISVKSVDEYPLMLEEVFLVIKQMFAHSNSNHQLISIVNSYNLSRDYKISLLKFLGRQDLTPILLTSHPKVTSIYEIRQLQESLISNSKQDNQMRKKDMKGEGGKTHMKLVEFLICRFEEDSRYREVQNMLNSAKDMVLKLDKISLSIPNFQMMDETQRKEILMKHQERIFIKNLAKMVGRGILQVGTEDTISTELIQPPPISKTFINPSELNSKSDLQLSEDVVKEMMQWPQFHNGAATALKVALTFMEKEVESSSHFMMRSWIMQHRPSTPKSDHAGFLLVLGLFGLLHSLHKTDIYQLLKSLHDSTTIAVLLGLSASKIGKMHPQFTKTLCMHITFLQPQNLFADISLPVQSAAVVGSGLLYMGSFYRQISEMLVAQISRKPTSEKSIEREVYALSSGIALGFVNLGGGSMKEQMMNQLGSLNLEERLLRFIEGGNSMELPKSMIQASLNFESQVCSSVREGDQVNVHITSSGALMALCFIYLQSHDQTIVDKLTMPDTFHQLDFVRPAFLMQKVLCRCLIMWDQIQPTEQYVESLLPNIIKFSYENPIGVVEKRFAAQIRNESIDFACIALCHANIITGGILAIGYRFAGTGNKQGVRVIIDYIQRLRSTKIQHHMNSNILHLIYTDKSKNLIDRYTQENCLVMCAIALSLVMAGTGDIEVFRLLRVIRKRLDHPSPDGIHYGHQMAINMALGFLFLGSGVFTLGKNKFAIACLLCALYPIFPRDPNDNRYHLQALRHFWVMAMESRLVQVRDVETGDFLSVGMKLQKVDEEGRIREEKSIKYPAFIEEGFDSLVIDDDKYLPFRLKLATDKKTNEVSSFLHFQHTIYLQKKPLEQSQQILHQKLPAQMNQEIIHKIQKTIQKRFPNFKQSFNQSDNQSLIKIRDPEQTLSQIEQLLKRIVIEGVEGEEGFEEGELVHLVRETVEEVRRRLLDNQIFPLVLSKLIKTPLYTQDLKQTLSCPDSEKFSLVIRRLGIPEILSPRDRIVSLPIAKVQACRILIGEFWNELQKQGEGKTVSEFKSMIQRSEKSQLGIEDLRKLRQDMVERIGEREIMKELYQTVVEIVEECLGREIREECGECEDEVKMGLVCELGI